MDGKKKGSKLNLKKISTVIERDYERSNTLIWISQYTSSSNEWPSSRRKIIKWKVKGAPFSSFPL